MKKILSLTFIICLLPALTYSQSVRRGAPAQSQTQTQTDQTQQTQPTPTQEQQSPQQTQPIQQQAQGTLTPARNVTGKWEGTLTSSDNNNSGSNRRTDRMTLDLVQKDNKVTGTMSFGSARGNLEGTISGVNIDFTCRIGNGCIKVHGTFTSTNMEGMRGSNPPPYITCGDNLNTGRGSKGIEWHLTKK